VSDGTAGHFGYNNCLHFTESDSTPWALVLGPTPLATPALPSVTRWGLFLRKCFITTFAWVGLELAILLPLPPEQMLGCWVTRLLPHRAWGPSGSGGLDRVAPEPLHGLSPEASLLMVS
jgi:hypothetical protein